MKKIVVFLILLNAYTYIAAQTQFYSTVKIEFEKNIAVRALMKEIEPEWYEQAKEHMSQNSLSYFDFVADSSHSIYKPGRQIKTDQRNMFTMVGNQNIVYTDFATHTSITQKPIYEEIFLVQDSLLKIKWKITNDTRNIAGFECRKAVGILFDTVAVFAFYTDELMISGGPEGIHGLPGMILGAGIPKLHTTWYATKVQVIDVPVTQIQPEKKGKKVSRNQMLDDIKNAMNSWSDYGKKMILATQI